MKIKLLLGAALLLLSINVSAADAEGSRGSYSDKSSFMSAVSSGEIPRLLAEPEQRSNAQARKSLWLSIITTLQTSYGLDHMEAAT